MVSIGFSLGAAGAGGDANTSIDSTVEAYARDAGLSAAGGVFIDADSAHTANALAIGAAASAVAVSAMFAEGHVGGETRAFADGILSVNSGQMQITADSVANALPDALSASISFDGGPGAAVKGSIDRTTEAYVGSRSGMSPTADTSLTINGGELLIQANSVFTATAIPISLGIGGNSIALALTQANINGQTLAYVGEATTVNAAELDVLATASETATANAVVVALAAGVGVSNANSFATVEGSVEAFLGSRAGIAPSAGAITDIDILAGGSGDGSVVVDASANRTADADASGGAASFTAAISSMLPVATVGAATLAGVNSAVEIDAASLDVGAAAENIADAQAIVASVSLTGAAGGAFASATVSETADVVARIGSGAVISTSGGVRVDARHQGLGSRATASAQGGAGGVFGGGAVMLSEAGVGGSVNAAFDGRLLTADSLQVEASGNNFARTETLAVGLGAFGGAGTGAVADVSSFADVDARVGPSGSVNVTNALTIRASGNNTAITDSDAGSGGIVGVSGSTLSARGNGQ